ncbi:hypothetical protein B6N60_00208 [Richelia sinica FACHB-800]|uniref:Uncharacterized protein n=1 Tax=Richelia sinica FACHB-800 TaxID=1357546 RepID=A0A975T3N5_9NOST|nr:hypothetical protein B6N60_00208 [Richelia sinica FACHB-800]
MLLIILLVLISFNLWQQYRWEKWCEQVNPIFYQLIRENQGKITPIDLAIRGNFSGTVAKRYLESKATEFGASVLKSEEDEQSYYFMTASILGDILDSSEPVKELPPQPVTKTALSLLAPPATESEAVETESEAVELVEDTETESESLPPSTEQQVSKPLEKQLMFGSLIQSELAKRLNVYSSTVYKRRNDPDFPEWSRNRDPDGIAWSYSKKTREFFPLDE